MAIPTANRPKGRSIKDLRMVWSFALRYPGHITIATLALLISSGATSGIPYAFKLIIDKGFRMARGRRTISRAGSNICCCWSVSSPSRQPFAIITFPG